MNGHVAGNRLFLLHFLIICLMFAYAESNFPVRVGEFLLFMRKI